MLRKLPVEAGGEIVLLLGHELPDAGFMGGVHEHLHCPSGEARTDHAMCQQEEEEEEDGRGGGQAFASILSNQNTGYGV